MKHLIFGGASAFVLALSSVAFGQDRGQDTGPEFSVENLGIEAGGSLLGLYLAPSYEISDQVNVRAVFTRGNVSTTQTIDGTTASGNLSTGSTSVLVDYYPFNNWFRISGGVTHGGYEMSATVSELTLGGVDFNGTDLSLTFAEKNSIAPVISLGFQRGFGALALVSDLGVRFNSFELSTTGQENLPNTDQFNTELDAFNRDLSDAIGILPVFSFGLSYRF